MKKFFMLTMLILVSVLWHFAAFDMCFAHSEGTLEKPAQCLAQADPAQSLKVTNSRLKVDTGFGSNLIAEAYVENTSDKRAQDVTVTFILNDPAGVTGSPGNSEPRTYAYYLASIKDLMPRSGQWVTITTTVANPKNIDDAGKTVTIEIIRRGDAFTTEVKLQYYFTVKAAGFSD